MKRILSSIFLILFLAKASVGQTAVCKGTVTSADGKPIPNVNILAKPTPENGSIVFAFTDEKGIYSLKLAVDITYDITVSYLGFVPQTISLSGLASGAASIKDFKLLEAENLLNEVTVNATIPVIVKTDTVIYNAASFATGDERKLRDLLEKMPGIQISDEGRITVRGKQVNKLMIEGKSFFNGPKLGINNIPADAVSKVEVIDNYDNVSYLKGLENDDVTAMNIRLKDANKGFAFGDIEGTAGADERYALQPKVFYYTPDQQINIIADLNNTGTKSFSIADYLNFENGTGRQAEYSYPDNDLTRFLLSKNYQNNTQQFSAANFRKTVSDFTELNAYVIYARNSTGTRNEMRNEFPGFLENRVTQEVLNSSLLNGKITLDHRPSDRSTLLLNSSITLRDNSVTGSTVSNQVIQNQQTLKGISLKQEFNYSRKFSSKHTVVFNGALQYLKDVPESNLQSNESLLPGIIPVVPDSSYQLVLQKKMSLFGANLEVKDYWILQPAHHIYFSIGAVVSDHHRLTNDYQLIGGNTENSFANNGFGNDLKYAQSDFYAGVEYKFRTGAFTIKPALVSHYYQWLGINKLIALPALLVKAELDKSRVLEFRYDLKSTLPDASMLASGRTMYDFNIVTQGQPGLANQLYHQAALSYRTFDFSKVYFLNLNVQYRQQLEQNKEVTVLEGIDQFTSYVMFYKPENDLSLTGDLSRKFGSLTYSLEGRYGFRDFYQLINEEMDQNTVSSYAVGMGVKTSFLHAPNVKLAYRMDKNIYRTNGMSSDFTEHQLKTGLQWRLSKTFSFDGDYVRSWYQKNTFDNLNATFQYQRKKGPWGFSLTGTNLLGIQFRRTNSFNALYVSDSRVFVLPRMILGKLTYKL